MRIVLAGPLLGCGIFSSVTDGTQEKSGSLQRESEFKGQRLGSHSFARASLSGIGFGGRRGVAGGAAQRDAICFARGTGRKRRLGMFTVAGIVLLLLIHRETEDEF